MNFSQQILDEKDIKAMELKFQGVSYKAISEQIGVEYQTVRSWFMHQGRLFQSYWEYATKEGVERKKNVRVIYRNYLLKAVETMGEMLDDKDPKIKFMAAREIISRNLDTQDFEVEDERKADIRGILAMIKEERENKLVETTTT
jgi:hypothetical protein